MTLPSSATRWVAAQQQSWETCSALRCCRSHFLTTPVCLSVVSIGRNTHAHLALRASCVMYRHVLSSGYICDHMLCPVHCASQLHVVQCMWHSARHCKVLHLLTCKLVWTWRATCLIPCGILLPRVVHTRQCVTALQVCACRNMSKACCYAG